jgi:hypothetical protein
MEKKKRDIYKTFFPLSLFAISYPVRPTRTETRMGFHIWFDAAESRHTGF